MTMEDSTTPRHTRKPRKPKKPSKNFPLFPHAGGTWCKKVLGKTHHFGSWRDDPNGTRALDRWLREKDDLLAGRVPRTRTVSAGAPTLGDLVNQFMVTKAALRDAGERSPRTWNAYSDACDELLAAFGASRLLTDLLPEDFQQLRASGRRNGGRSGSAPKSPASRPSSITHGRNV